MDNIASNNQQGQSLYRKWRSQTFGELVGQEHVVRTLQNALATGRLAHAYLFTGPRGTGKTSTARLMAKAVNCLRYSAEAVAAGQSVPCGQCANCQAVAEGNAIDLVEIDAASNTGVDDVRVLRDGVNFSPSLFKYRVYIIDEVHMLSTAAFNALLKTLEEPPEHAIFILATTEVHKIPATVLSRCQRYDFRRVPLGDMVARAAHVCAEEGIVAEPAALELLCRTATGSMRDALSLLDQLVAYNGTQVTLAAAQDMLGATGGERVAAFVDNLLAGELGVGLGQISAMQEDGVDLRQFNRQLVDHLRNLMLLKAGGASLPTLDVTQETLGRLQGQAEAVNLGQIVGWVKTFSAADSLLRSTPYGQLPLEVAFVEATLAGAEQQRVEQPRTSSPQPLPASRPQPPVGNQQPPRLLRPAVEPQPDQPASQPAAVAQVKPPARSEPPLLVVQPMAVTELVAVAELVATEKPVAVAEAVETASDGSISLEQMTAAWPRIVGAMEVHNKMLKGVLLDVYPISIEGGTVVLGCKYPFHYSKTNDPTNRLLIEQLIGKVVGGDWQVICQLLEGQVAPARRATLSERAQAARQDVRVRAVVSIFNGTITDVKEQ